MDSTEGDKGGFRRELGLRVGITKGGLLAQELIPLPLNPSRVCWHPGRMRGSMNPLLVMRWLLRQSAGSWPSSPAPTVHGTHSRGPGRGLWPSNRMPKRRRLIVLKGFRGGMKHCWPNSGEGYGSTRRGVVRGGQGWPAWMASRREASAVEQAGSSEERVSPAGRWVTLQGCPLPPQPCALAVCWDPGPRGIPGSALCPGRVVPELAHGHAPYYQTS